MHYNSNMKKYIWVAVLMMSTGVSFGQTDSLSRLQFLLNSCNMFRQLPVRVELSVKRSSNIGAEREDTVSMEVDCYIGNQDTYLSMGDLEQIANDSLLLQIDNKTKRMLLYHHSQSIRQRVQEWMGFAFGDSLLQKIEKSYTIA